MSSTTPPILDGDAILRAARTPEAQARAHRYYKRQSWNLARKMDLQHRRPSRRPADLGLTAAEIRAEGRRLMQLGWTPDEVVAVLPDPRTAAA